MHLCDPKGEHGRLLGRRPMAIWLQTPRLPKRLGSFRPSTSWRIAQPWNMLTLTACDPRLSKRAKVAIVDPASRDTSEQPWRLPEGFQRHDCSPDSLISQKISQKDFICACLAFKVLQVLENSKHSLLHTYDHQLKVQSPFKYVRVYSSHLDLHSGV